MTVLPRNLKRVVPIPIREHLKRFIKTTAAERFYRRPAAASDERQVRELSCDTDATLVIVTFNAPDLTEWQLYALEQHFEDSKLIILADNSTSMAARARIRSLAHDYGAVFRALPTPPPAKPSYSHGLALNWVHRNLLAATQSAYIGFLDHDIFPICRVSYKERLLHQRSLGRVRQHQSYFYYWPGFSLFDRTFFGATADFRPHPIYGDTGASNWPRYYSALNGGNLHPCTFRDMDIDVLLGKRPDKGARSSGSMLELIDDCWVHPRNGSNWAGEGANAVLARRRELAAVLAHYGALPAGGTLS